MALEKWRVGSERPDALYLQPEQMAKNQPIPLTRDMLFLATLAGLEGSRLEEAGAMGQAWEWYRACSDSAGSWDATGVALGRRDCSRTCHEPHRSLGGRPAPMLANPQGP